MGKYKVFVAADGQFYFNLCATNGRIIGTSETYKRVEGAFTGMKSVMNNCLKDEQFEVRKDVDKKSYFVLKAANGEIILKSESYSSPSKCMIGIASVKKNGTTELIEMPKSLADQIQKKEKPMSHVERNRKRPENLKSNKVQRNAKCPCGSGKKFKQCCIDNKLKK